MPVFGVDLVRIPSLCAAELSGQEQGSKQIYSELANATMLVTRVDGLALWTPAPKARESSVEVPMIPGRRLSEELGVHTHRVVGALGEVSVLASLCIFSLEG